MRKQIKVLGENSAVGSDNAESEKLNTDKDSEVTTVPDVALSTLDFLPENSHLKPKLDRIFAEVENNLPTINFELSDLSSEEDVPIFNRALKTLSSRGSNSVSDSSGDEIEKQTYEENAHQVEQPIRRHLAIHSADSIADSKSVSAAAAMLHALERETKLHSLGTRNSDDKRISANFEDLSSEAVKSENRILVDVQTNRTGDDADSQSSNTSTKGSAVKKSRSNELEKKSGKRTTTPSNQNHLQANSQKMVAMFFPDNSLQLDLELNNIGEMLSGGDCAFAALGHGDNASVYHCRSSQAIDNSRNDESLMEKLRKFAMMSSSSQDNGNISSGSKRESSSSSSSIPGKNSETRFCARGTSTGGTSTGGYFSQQSCFKRDLRSSCQENATIYLDLRTFDDQKRKEQENVERIQRVLGLTGTNEGSDSSDESTGELELWFEHRKRIKESLKSGALSAEENVSKAMSQKSTSPARQPGSENGKPLPLLKSPMRLSSKFPTALKDSPSGGSTIKLSEATEPGEHVERDAADDEAERCITINAVRQNSPEVKKMEKSKKLPSGQEPARKTSPMKANHVIADVSKATRQLEQRLQSLRPTTSARGRQRAASATDPVFDTTVSYEPQPQLLPSGWSDYPECTLLTVHLSSNGQIVCHDSLRNSVRKSIDQACSMSASYNALVTWLLSLVPGDFEDIGKTGREFCSAPFHVIGLQQMAQEGGGHLVLNVVVTPVKSFTNRDIGLKGKKRLQKESYKDLSPFHKILKQFLLRNTLHSVCPFTEALESVEVSSLSADGGKGTMYLPSLPQISSQPLSTFIQLNAASDAIHKFFLLPVGFFWQTVETEEQCHSDHLSKEGVVEQSREPDEGEEIQTMMTLVYEKVYYDCFAMIGILNRVLQQGLCLCGFRLVYPTPDLLRTVTPKPAESSASAVDPVNILGPILALAVRGMQARKVWLDVFGPADPALARRTDPNSLCAQYGGESRDECLLFCPRTPQRIQQEIVRWFGGRVPPDGMIDLEVAETVRSAVHGVKRSGSQSSTHVVDRVTIKPVATLTATTKSDVFLVVSPLVPVSSLGLVLALAQQRGYQLNGIRRLHLNAKQVTVLGISGSELASFVACSSQDHRSGTVLSSLRPSTVFLLNKENARSTSGSLLETIMTHLTMQNILEVSAADVAAVQSVNSTSLFHISAFSPQVLQTLRGDFAKLPEDNLLVRPGCVPTHLYSNPELEQVVLVSVCGTRNRQSGIFLGRLLGVLPYAKRSRTDEADSEAFELLGLKWLPRLTIALAKELTPYEVGDRKWKSSIQKLSSQPALLTVVRGVNAFKRMESILHVSPLLSQSLCHQVECSLDCVMSHTAEMAYRLISIFFSDCELFSDNTSRPALRYFPAPRLNSECPSDRGKLSKSSRRSESSSDDFSNSSESIILSLLSEPQLLTAFLLVKPDAVCRHTGSVLKHIYLENFVIVAMRLELLARGDVQKMLGASTEPAEVEYICKSPCLLLVLQRQNAVKKLLDVVGPANPQETRSQGIYTWRTLFGMNTRANGLHCSSDYRKSIEDQKLFFSGLCCHANAVLRGEQIVCPAVDNILDISHLKTRRMTSSSAVSPPGSFRCISGLTETTSLLLAPPLLQKPNSRSTKPPPYVDIIDSLLQSEFELVGCRMVWLSQTQAEHLLKLLKTGSFDMVTLLSSGPSIVLAFQKDVAILALKEFISCDSKAMFRGYEADLFYAKDLGQAGELLTYFFDKLSPSSLAQVVPSCPE